LDDTSDLENEIILTASEENRFDDMVFNLDPFPAPIYVTRKFA
jgi:hypothetical protein